MKTTTHVSPFPSFLPHLTTTASSSSSSSKPNLHPHPSYSTMADQSYRQQLARGSNTRSFLHKLQEHSPNSTQLVGFMTLVISGVILLLLTGLTLTITVLGLIFFTPLILISSPIWVPAGTIIFLVSAGFLSFLGFGIGVVAVISWLYRYFRGFHPPGSDRVDYARSRIADTASHMKDYAKEYGEYWQGKTKDAAPGA